MANFQNRLVEHLASKLNVPEQDVSIALNSFCIVPKIVKTGDKKVVGKDSLVQHKCERPPRGKDHPCGKPAANELTFQDGSIHWYCGTLKKGCTRSMITELEKKEKAKAAELIAEETEQMRREKKKPSKKTSKKDTEKTILDLLNKKRIAPLNKPQLKKMKTKNGTVWIHGETRIVFHERKRSKLKGDSFAEAYGILTKDESIGPLGKKEKEWLEKQRIQIATDHVTEPEEKPEEPEEEQEPEEPEEKPEEEQEPEEPEEKPEEPEEEQEPDSEEDEDEWDLADL